MVCCVAVNCSSRDGQGIIMHRFSRDPKRRIIGDLEELDLLEYKYKISSISKSKFKLSQLESIYTIRHKSYREKTTLENWYLSIFLSKI